GSGNKLMVTLSQTFQAILLYFVRQPKTGK
ncbi:MAG: hypothetical protein ACI9YP_001468, partial [Colwellia sp.]